MFPRPPRLLWLPLCLVATNSLHAGAPLYWRFEGNPPTKVATAKNELSGGSELKPPEPGREPKYSNEAPKLPHSTQNKSSVAFEQLNRSALALTEANSGNFKEDSQFTIELWMKPAIYAQNPDVPLTILHKRVTPADGSSPGILLAITAEGNLVFRADARDAAAKGLTSKTAIPMDKWTHVAIGRDGEGKLTMRVNGEVESVSSGALTSALESDCGLMIGANRTMMNPQTFFEGCLDELRISDSYIETKKLLYRPQ